MIKGIYRVERDKYANHIEHTESEEEHKALEGGTKKDYKKEGNKCRYFRKTHLIETQH